MTFLCPEISKIKYTKKFSLRNLAQYNTFMSTIIFESYFIRTTFCLVIIGTVSLLNFLNKKTKKWFLEYFTNHQKYLKMDPLKLKIQKSEHNTNFMLIYVQKDIWDDQESMGYGGGGV